jgi:putative transposase
MRASGDDQQIRRRQRAAEAATLGERIEQHPQAPITPIRHLFLDATFLDARWARNVENVSALMAAATPHGADRDEERN